MSLAVQNQEQMGDRYLAPGMQTAEAHLARLGSSWSLQPLWELNMTTWGLACGLRDAGNDEGKMYKLGVMV